MQGNESAKVPTAPASGTHLCGSKRVTLSDVLEHLSSETTIGSSFGAALERARDGTSGAADYVRARADAEVRLLSRAPVIRCVDALTAARNLFRVGEACCNVRRFAVRVHLPEGAAVVAVLRSFQPWATSSSERGLAAVYEWMLVRQPSLPAIDTGGEVSVAQAFRMGKCKRQRAIAAGMLADSEVAIHSWVEGWNRKGDRGLAA